jgi:hypothetical protein
MGVTETGTQEWGEFLHKPNEMFYDFAEIRNEIIRETERLTGSTHFPFSFFMLLMKI